jgi:hypothetical protein
MKVVLEVDTEKPKDIESAYSILDSLNSTPEQPSTVDNNLELARRFQELADQFKKPTPEQSPIQSQNSTPISSEHVE